MPTDDYFFVGFRDFLDLVDPEGDPPVDRAMVWPICDTLENVAEFLTETNRRRAARGFGSVGVMAVSKTTYHKQRDGFYTGRPEGPMKATDIVLRFYGISMSHSKSKLAGR